MKKFTVLTFILLLFRFFPAISQTVVAHYSVSQEIVGSGPFQDKILATIESKGYLYRDGARYLYYEKPSYLGKYPNGSIELQVDDSHSYNYGLCTDSLQYINLTNTDSLVNIFRPHVNGSNSPKFNYRRHYDADYFSWQMLPETKVIDGLKCQKATMSVRNKLQWMVWFTPSVHMESGINGIVGLQGLVVEAECIPLHIKYSLSDFSESVPIKPAVFELAELKQPYEQRPPLLKANSIPTIKSKALKQADITNQ